jgi:hypothetical protein
LGSAVCLLSGYKLGWNPSDPDSSPFFDVPQPAVAAAPATLADGDTGSWGYPLITLHDTAESLLSAVYDLQIVHDESGSNYGSGALLVRNVDRDVVLADLKQEFGVDFAVPNRGYALIEIRREAGTSVHSTFARGVFITPNPRELQPRGFLRTLATLPTPRRASQLPSLLNNPADADTYLTFFAQSGTHYVSSITAGDRILQILAYDADHWQQLNSDFANFPDELQGPNAFQNFALYTRPLNPEGYGNVAEQGGVTIASRDPAFAQSVASQQWLDNKWAQGNSILTPFLTSSVDLTQFTKVVPISVELSPVSLFMDADHKDAAGQVFRAGMATIYGEYVNPDFPSAPDADFGGVYPPARTGLLSALATPTINTYVQRFNLSTLQLALPDVVKQFNLVSNLLEIQGSGSVALPGSQISLFADIINVVAPADGSVPTLMVADDAYDTFFLTCDLFFGALYIANASGSARKLIADGLVYELGPAGTDGRSTVNVTGGAHSSPTLEHLQAVATQLSAAVTGGDALLAVWQALAPAAGLRTVTRLLQWVAGLIPSDCSDPNLALIRLDALYAAGAAQALMGGKRQVPYLTYKAYQPAVEAVQTVAGQISQNIANYQYQITQRKLAEMLVKDIQTLNQNIIDTGQLLSGYIQAVAQNQKDVAEQYAEIADADKAAIDATLKTVDTLQQSVNDQRAVVETAIENYMTAVRDKELEEIVTLSFEIAKTIFEVAAAPEAPEGASADAIQLAKIIKRIQKLPAVFAAIQKLSKAISGASADIKAADSALSEINQTDSDNLGTLDWDEFRVSMKNAIEQGPDDSTRLDVEDAVDILVLRGEALVRAQTAAATLTAQDYRDLRTQKINQDQAARLQNLQTLIAEPVGNLQPDSIDLIGLTGDLDQLQSQMMQKLARFIVIQDLALQYEYLQQPTVAPSTFDLISLGVYITSQQGKLLAAKSALSPVPTAIQQPVSYTLANIPAAALANGGVFRFQIPLAAKEFSPYTMVRIAGIDLSVEGIQAAENNQQFVVQLLYRGEPFYDLDPQHNPLEFSTNARITNYLGTVAADGPSTASAGSDVSAGDYSLVTPFSDWGLSFPVNTLNQGISFAAAGITLTMSFHLVAQINPTAVARINLDALATAAPGGDPTTLLAAMQGNSCLMGWDAVFSYTEDKINAFLLAQYDALKKANAGHLVIPSRTDTTTPDPNTGIATYTTWQMTLGAPRVEFASGNNQYATVYMDMLDATYEYGFVMKDGSKVKQTFFPPPPLPSDAYIKGQVALGTVQGSVTSQHSVVLNLPAGTWNISMSDIETGNPTFNSFLTTQLATVSTSYELGTLDLVANPTLPALTPTSFKFNVIETNSGRNLLQLFIVTDGTAPNQLSLNNVPEPVPSGSDCSLLISSRVLFQRILPQSFIGATSLLTILGVSPSDASSSWSASASSGTLNIPVNLGDSSNEEGNMRLDAPGIQLDMSGLTIGAGSQPNYDLALAFSRTFNQGFEVYGCSEGHYQGMCLGGGWDDHSVNVTTTLNTTLPIAVTGTGQQQSVQIQESSLNIDATGAIASGPCSGGNLQTALVQAYRAAAIPAITAAVAVTFPALSIFALKNLLFPAANMVDMSLVYVPGDLVILGSFPT